MMQLQAPEPLLWLVGASPDPGRDCRDGPSPRPVLPHLIWAIIFLLGVSGVQRAAVGRADSILAPRTVP